MGELGMVNSDGATLKEEQRSVWSLGTTPSPPDPASFSEDCLLAAEEAAAEVLNCIHPTLDSDENRRDVIDHLQKLIETQLNCEVFPYGSVPLKTYLPDGDIDLTVIKVPNAEESLAHDVLAVLKKEEQKEDTHYQVMDTQFIDAEVKLVKCLVQNIVIDISFNQLGGLSTLCFLEQVDRLVGRNHLFKRSIVLIKAWCFYESRILGAMHGLVSTYALETLILYIFHLFHSSLSGPLMALYRFLDYYSQFDWDNYCISLKGPVRKSSLPNIVVKLPNSGWNDLLLGEEFMVNCVEMFSVPYRGSEVKAFQTKHLNIIDPLKENNNLGRSVHRGNFHRIRSAFKYGARKLGKALLQPRERIAEEINKFFANILSRHGNIPRNCIEHFALEFGDEVSSTTSLSSDGDLFSEDGKLRKSSVSDFDKDSVGIEEKYIFKNNLDRGLTGEVPTEVTSQVLRSPAKNETFEAGNFRPSDMVNTHLFDCSSWLKNRDKYAEINHTHQLCVNNLEESLGINGSGSSTHKPGILENLCDDVTDLGSSGIGGVSATIDSLADLSGDYDSHIRSLLHGQLCHGFASSASMVSNPSLAPFTTRGKKRFDIVSHPMPLRRTFFHTTARSGGKANVRVTGTYFPNMKGFYRKRSSQGRGMNKTQRNHSEFLDDHRSDCSYSAVGRSKSFGSDAHDFPSAQSRSEGQLESDEQAPCPCSVIDGKQTNSNSSPCRIEFGSIGTLAEELLSRITNVSGTTPRRSEEMQGSSTTINQERFARPSMYLKNKDDRAGKM